jgi:hypothetical protein
MTKPKPSDIPQAIRDRAAAQMQDTLYDDIYGRLIDAYGRKPIRWIFAAIGVIGFVGSLLYSVMHGYTVYDWPIYSFALFDGIALSAGGLILYLGIVLSRLSDKEKQRIEVGLAFLMHRQPSSLRVTTLKNIATAGAGAGQTRTIPALFLVGLAASLFGKELFSYITTPIKDALSLGFALVYMILANTILDTLGEIQKASIDTDILKAIAYNEEYLAEEAHNPAPALIQPVVASTPAPAAKPTPTAAKTTSHGQQPQPKQAPQAQPQRKKKRR